jgi:hypothetical protein
MNCHVLEHLELPKFVYKHYVESYTYLLKFLPAGSVILNTETGAIEVCHTKPVSIVHLRSQP